MSNNKKYWKGVEELHETPEFQSNKHKEFSEYLPVEDFLGDEKMLENASTSRRDFLKYLGFGVTAASLAACEAPVNNAIPYVVKPEKVSPGVANWYATTYMDGNDYCNILVKTREGRPIKIEGNKLSPVTKGGVNARVNSSVLSLYDGNRYKAPMINGETVSWSKFDEDFGADLKKIAASGGKIRIITGTIVSPTTQVLINAFIEKMGGDVKQVNYDTVSYSGFLAANKADFGTALMASYDFSKAKTIVSIGADFLANWPTAIENTAQYAERRNPDGAWMSKHFQFETTLSLTGSNADVRTPIKPSEHGKVVAGLYNYLSGKGVGSAPHAEKIKAAGDALMQNKGASLVVAGANDTAIQQVVNGINQLLGNYGSTLDMDAASNLKRGMDSDMTDLIAEMNSGSVDAVLVYNVDPIYSLPQSSGFAEAFEKVSEKVSFASRPDMTSEKCKYVAPVHHYLESWDDASPKKGQYAMVQPTISPLFDTRQFQDSLLTWMGEDKSYYHYLQGTWEQYGFAQQSKFTLFRDFWNTAVQDGVFAVGAPVAAEGAEESAPAGVSYSGNAAAAVAAASSAKGSDLEIQFYEKVGIGDGSQAHNPWLQELPDPISKITWDNYVTMNPSDARANEFATSYGQEKDADTINLTVNGVTFENVPVVAQPGQAAGTLGVALGYGKKVGKMEEATGFNAFPARKIENGGLSNFATNVSMEAAGGKHQIASTQTHHTIMGRDSVVRETTLDTYKTKDKDAYNAPHLLATHDGKVDIKDMDLWQEHPVENVGHRWGMTVDLNTCIGCSACITSCSSENNVPVVGKDEVRRSREMHWIRIDRYFSSAEEYKPESEQSYGLLEIPEDNPKVVHQPMMCQHCNHAPCETVCPVAATTHSNEGLNQMTYNRCIGTRYCANNCPYKVRRFNWFNYQALDKFTAVNPAQDDLGRMVLNPDVTVRARGVMEKCSMCVQRIQEGKLNAKREGRKVVDGEIETACASACPTNAIRFGDLNDENSLVRTIADTKRSYQVIEEVGTRPNIYYQVKVRNEENLA